jgi:hypothetical protein
MNKKKNPKTIEVKERIKLKIGDKEYEFEFNTPTPEFYNDLYDEITLGTDGVKVMPLNKIQVLDSAGAVGAEITSANWSLTKGTAKITISGSATWNSDNPPARLKILNTVEIEYFETSLPAGISAQRGLPITVTWEASFSMNISSATGYLAGSNIIYVVYLDKLVDILANQREGKSLAIRKASYYYTDNYEWVVDVLGSITQHSLRIPPTQVPKAGSINSMFLCTSTNICFTFVFSSPLNVSSGDYVSLDIYFV